MPLLQLSPSELNPQNNNRATSSPVSKSVLAYHFFSEKYQHFLIDSKEGQDDGELKNYPRIKTTEDFCVIFDNIIYTENVRQKH